MARDWRFSAPDWLKRTRALTLAERGAWIDVLCMMRDGAPCGTLTYRNGAPMDDSAVARALGVPVKTWRSQRAALIEKGVASEVGGALVSRRMMREGGRGAKAKDEPSAEARALAREFAEAIRSHSPEARVNPEAWTADLDRMLRLDKRAPEQVRAVIEFVHRGTTRDALFWRPNLLSGRKLRQHFDRLAMLARGRPTSGTPSRPDEFGSGRVQV